MIFTERHKPIDLAMKNLSRVLSDVAVLLLPITRTKSETMSLQLNTSRITLAGVVCIMLTGCGPESSQPSGNDLEPSNSTASIDEDTPRVDDTIIANVRILADGTILLDNKQVTIDQLKADFAKLKGKNGVVWYYRENGTGEPPRPAMLVMQAVVEAQLPIKLSSKPDFSDTIGSSGN